MPFWSAIIPSARNIVKLQSSNTFGTHVSGSSLRFFLFLFTFFLFDNKQLNFFSKKIFFPARMNVKRTKKRVDDEEERRRRYFWWFSAIWTYSDGQNRSQAVCNRLSGLFEHSLVRDTSDRERYSRKIKINYKWPLKRFRVKKYFSIFLIVLACQWVSEWGCSCWMRTIGTTWKLHSLKRAWRIRLMTGFDEIGERLIRERCSDDSDGWCFEMFRTFGRFG